MKIDNVDFNAEHWRKKSKSEFVKSNMHNAPKKMQDAEKKQWLENAYALIKGDDGTSSDFME